MQNQINLSEEPSDYVFFQVYLNILCEDNWEIIEYPVPINELNDLELKILTKAVERRLKQEEKMTDC
jgi:hypothetical protein